MVLAGPLFTGKIYINILYIINYDIVGGVSSPTYIIIMIESMMAAFVRSSSKESPGPLMDANHPPTSYNFLKHAFGIGVY